MTAAFKQQGNAEHLIEWFNNGADGQIDWGTPGDFEACVQVAEQHMDPEFAHGFCQLRHIDATGEPAGPGAHGGSQSVTPLFVKQMVERLRIEEDT